MKKIIVLPLLLLVSVLSFGQSENNVVANRRGNALLPVAGNWGLGFDVIPIIKTAGNLLYDSDEGNGTDFFTQYPYTFSGYYVKSENKYYRAKLRLGLTSTKSDTLVQRAGSTNPNETVANETKTGNTNINLGAGVQWIKGARRLRGIYGLEGFFGISSTSTKYTYGNELNGQNPEQNRVVSEKSGSGIRFSARGFLGVEYFFAPSMSLSAEYGLAIGLLSQGRGEVETESWNGNGVDTRVSETSKNSSFGIDNDISGGAISLNFYF